jgi:aminomethyltransferase
MAEKILQPLTRIALADIKSFYFAFGDVASVRCLIARTGYTGEAGFELYCEAGAADQLWRGLLEAGVAHGLAPAGLGARDTLRLEKAYPLYGHELDDTTTPLEAGLDWVVKFSKHHFIGREILVKQKEAGPARKLVGVELVEPGIARAGYRLFKGDEPIGTVTSGTRSPSLEKSIALGYIAGAEAKVGNSVAVEIRGRKVGCKTVELPFYR